MSGLQFTVERDAMLKELARVVGVVSPAGKSTIPILSHIHIDAGGDTGEFVLLRGTDLDIEITAPCPAIIEKRGATTVEGRLLHDIVKKCPEGSQIGITLDGGRSRLKIVNGRARFDLRFMEPEDFPTLDGPTGRASREFILLAKELRDLLGATRIAVSNDETRHYLNGIYFHQLDEQLVAVATDGHRLSMRTGVPLPAGADGMAGVILPRKLVAELLRWLPSEGEIAIEVSAARFAVTVGEFRMLSKLIDGTFPEYRRVIPQETGSGFVADRAELIKRIERVATVAEAKGRAVNLVVEPNGLQLQCRSLERGTAFDDLDALVDGAGLTIGVNGGYLLDILGAMDCEKVRISYADPSSALRITAQGDDGATQLLVLMPMRADTISDDRRAP